MLVSAPLTFDRSQVQVEDLMGQGAAFSNVEDAIDTAPLSTLHKAALWLLAWSLRDTAVQRREACRMLAAVAAEGREACGAGARGAGPTGDRPRAAEPMLRLDRSALRPTARGSVPSPADPARGRGRTR